MTDTPALLILTYVLMFTILAMGVSGFIGMFFPGYLLEKDAGGIRGIISDALNRFPERVQRPFTRFAGLGIAVGSVIAFMPFQRHMESHDFGFADSKFVQELVVEMQKKSSYSIHPEGSKAIRVKNNATNTAVFIDVKLLQMDNDDARSSPAKLADRALKLAEKKMASPEAVFETMMAQSREQFETEEAWYEERRRKKEAEEAEAEPLALPGLEDVAQANAEREASENPGARPTPNPERDRDLKQADEYVRQAGLRWESKDYRKSIELAERALTLRKKHLRSSDSKVSEVKEMIKAAKKLSRPPGEFDPEDYEDTMRELDDPDDFESEEF